ncbi:Vps5-domain-containing protein [Backusella circina FSU 941]|nr:Vps5-domain-containing protein [Backusella circina FSU 941]
MNNFEPNQSILSFGDDSLESNPFADTTPSYTQPILTEEDDQQVVSTDHITEEPESIHQEEDSSLEQESVEPESSMAETDTQSESLQVPKSGSRPFFEVTIEDPQKVGDAINAHIVYKVRTKTNSPSFRSPEFVVARRYRDFLWLYNQLTLGNPGVIVPPVPEKHALGRFQDDFVESRRMALERCLQKIVAHPMLYGDPDLKVFLESDSFNVEKRQRRAEPETSKISFMRSFGETLSIASSPFSKFVEIDEWFGSKKNQLDALEAQLKALLKSVEGVSKQRKELGTATSDFGESMFPLASAELNRNLSTHLKIAFNARVKAYQTHQQADSDLQKKITLFEKLKSQKVKPDKLQSAQQEINEMKQKVEELHQEFNDISKLIKNELDRFDKEKVEDFRDSVEQFLKSMIEHQKEIIALWETYFERTEGLDDEEEDDD